MKRIESLDGLRGVSIIAVLLGHSAVFLGGHPERLRVYSPIVEGGALGVDIFFVLSGFLITSVLVRMHDEDGRISLRSFFLNRATRLLPALYVMLAVYTIVHLAHGVPFGDFGVTIKSALLYVVNWQKHLGWGEPTFDLVPLWSLSTEEQFYLLWPLVMILLLGRRRRFAITVVVALCIAAISWRYLYTSARGPFEISRLDLRCDGLLVGSAAALIHSRRTMSGTFARVMFVLGSVGVVAHLAFGQLLTMYMGQVGLAIFNVSVAALILGLVNNGSPVSGLLTWSPLTAVGRVAYGIYLWHLPVWYYFLTYHGTWPLRVLVPVSTSVVGIATFVSWRFIEQPAMRLRRYWLPATEAAPPLVSVDRSQQ